MTARIALVGDLRSEVVAHRAIPLALRDAGERAKRELAWDWVPTPRLANGAAASALAEFHAIWCVPGSPYASTEGALAAIALAREERRPFLGTCGGFQHALMEHARSQLGVAAPAHAELEPDAADPVITPLECSLVGERGVVRFATGSRIARAHGALEREETYHCRYGVSSRWASRLTSGALRAGAHDARGELRAVELDGHPFFLATLYQPERAALAGESHPLIAAFVAAAISRQPTSRS
jgi:CTP synthase (UTP-ammonia lyase)